MTMSQRALLIINPVAGRRIILRYIPRILRIFMEAGYQVTTMVTGRRGEAVELAGEYGGGFDLVVCTGGDGTLNETISGLARAGIRVPLGYIPCGTTNNFANSRGLSTDILTAAERIAAGDSTRHDIGIFGEHYFVDLATFGIFTWMGYSTDQNLKNHLGYTAYLLDGMRDLSKLRPQYMELTADGVSYQGEYIFGAVSNCYSLAGVVELPEELVDTCDGRLEVVLVKAPKTLLELDSIAHSIRTRDYSGPFFELFQAREIEVRNPQGVEWSLDGESSGVFERVEIRPIPGFLELRG